VTGDVTGSELAKVCQQSHVSVTGHNRIPPQGSHPESEVHGMGGLWGADRVLCTAVEFEMKAETSKLSWQMVKFRTGIWN